MVILRDNRLIDCLTTVVCRPRMHRAGGRSDGLGCQDVWTGRRLLEYERSGWRCHSGQMMILSGPTSSIYFLGCLDYRF